MLKKESFLPVFKDQCCYQGCDDHNEGNSDSDDLMHCQTCQYTERPQTILIQFNSIQFWSEAHLCGMLSCQWVIIKVKSSS